MLCKFLKILGIKSIKDLLEVFVWVATVVIAWMTWNIYHNENIPIFEINVIQEEVGSSLEQFLQISNNGNPIKTKTINVIPVLWIEKTENEDSKTLKTIPVKMENYFFEKNNFMKYSNAKVGVIFREETNFHYREIQDSIYDIRMKLNDILKTKTVQIYSNISYFVEINYTDKYSRKNTLCYEVGRFETIEIPQSKYLKVKEIYFDIDFDKPYIDELYDIIK